MKRKVLSILLTLSILSLLVTCTVTPFYLLIDLNQALALLKQYLCLPETSTGTETNRAIYLGINLHTGDVILEDNPFNAGFQTTVGQEAFFFVLDEDPLARLAHVLRYLLVARSDGSILLNQLVKWTPLVNGVAVMSAELFDPTTGLLWQNYPGNQLTPSARSQIRAAPVKDVTNEVEGAIVVNGNNPAKYPDAGISKDAENMKGFYDSFAPMSEVEALDPPDNTESDLEGAIEDMYVAGVEDLTIYIATHGGSDMVVMGSSTMTAAEFADTIAEYPDMTFKVILDSCKSGSFMDELSTLPNVAIALTSTSATQSAYGDIDGADDPNPDDEGGE
ncbi:MAG TPA: C13 family peptidase, partial [Thermotogota bacterium]|nr:C13 family peptidase [Thermotogota bacterium]